MLRRLISAVLLAWALGFIWFAVALPQPAGGWAPTLLVSGVDRDVKPHEFAIEYRIGSLQMACCVTLGFAATDTATNARETADWIAGQKLKSVRVVTSDWHMRRAVMELRKEVPATVTIVEDAVPTQPSLRMLFLEYHKLLARMAWRTVGG
jgi:hypothetical protein